MKFSDALNLTHNDQTRACKTKSKKLVFECPVNRVGHISAYNNKNKQKTTTKKTHDGQAFKRASNIIHQRFLQRPLKKWNIISTW